MTKILLRDVGDGLNLIISNDDYHDLTVDFGGDENLDSLCYFEDSFLLTHFHADHYNGILNCDQHHCYWDLDNFYHPAMPKFTDSKVFYMSLLAMNVRISYKHPIQSSILTLINKRNRKPINFCAVSKGDIIVCGKRKYEILWPPMELSEEETLTDIRNAIKNFEEAKKHDSQLNEIYSQIYKSYSSRNLNEVNGNEESNQDPLTEFNRALPEIVQKANDSLRKAANRLSIAFRQDDNILFLGDLESHEINLVAHDLVLNNNVVYDNLISAHHGTHWHKSLTSIRCDNCLASVGKTLRNHIKYEYRIIANRFVRTDEWRDIRITKRNNVR